MNINKDNRSAAGKRLIRASLITIAAGLMVTTYADSLRAGKDFDPRQFGRSLKVMIAAVVPAVESIQTRTERRNLPGGIPISLRNALRNATSDA